MAYNYKLIVYVCEIVGTDISRSSRLAARLMWLPSELTQHTGLCSPLSGSAAATIYDTVGSLFF